MKVAVISGGSSGIGLACAEMLNAGGYKVYELSRNGKGDKGIFHITADITDEASVSRAFESVYNAEKRIDLVVNNAGWGISGAAEFTETEKAVKQFDVNFFGTFRCIKKALPYLRESRGKIINISSVAAEFPLPFQSFYSASKSAINSFTLALGNEVRPLGVKVSAVMPGDVKTGFTSSRDKLQGGTEIYGKVPDKAVKIMEHDEKNGMTPESIAKKVLKIAKMKNPAPLYTVGFKYKLVLFLRRLLPCRFINFVLGKIYG